MNILFDCLTTFGETRVIKPLRHLTCINNSNVEDGRHHRYVIVNGGAQPFVAGTGQINLAEAQRRGNESGYLLNCTQAMNLWTKAYRSPPWTMLDYDRLLLAS